MASQLETPPTPNNKRKREDGTDHDKIITGFSTSVHPHLQATTEKKPRSPSISSEEERHMVADSNETYENSELTRDYCHEDKESKEDDEEDEVEEDEEDDEDEEVEEDKEDDDEDENDVYMGVEPAGLVFMDYSNLQDPYSVSSRDDKDLLQSDSILKDAVTGSVKPLEVLLKKTLRYLKNRPPRDISVLCTFRYGTADWRYNNTNFRELLPFLITQLNPSDKQCASFLRSAPKLSLEAPYPVFNHEDDTLSLEYLRCGGENLSEGKMYRKAIREAIRRIKDFADHNPHLPAIERIKVSYCGLMVFSMFNFVAGFQDFTGLEELTLEAHHHGFNRDYYQGAISLAYTEFEQLSYDKHSFRIVYEDKVIEAAEDEDSVGDDAKDGSE